jgi:hypothetical protein
MLVDKVAEDVLTSSDHSPFSALNVFNPGHPAVALPAEIDVSCAASQAPCAVLSALLALPHGKLLLASSRCGELAHA